MSRTIDVLPPYMQQDEILAAVAQVADRWGDLADKIDHLSVHNIDTLPISFVRYLAHQCRVEGWQALPSDDARRDAVRRAIDLIRKKGTPWAVQEAIKSAGYAGAVLEEGLPQLFYDSARTYDGTDEYGAGARWALFRIVLDLGEDRGLSSSEIQLLVDTVSSFKNARSHLDDVIYEARVTDAATVTEESDTGATLAALDLRPAGKRYDGSLLHDHATMLRHDGSVGYGGVVAYGLWLGAGESYDNAWDVASLYSRLEIGESRVRIVPRYDGRLVHAGFLYSVTDIPAVDPPMTMQITKMVRYDGRRRHAGDLYSGSLSYAGETLYYSGDRYAGDIASQEVAA